jgi:hypothetical protein
MDDSEQCIRQDTERSSLEVIQGTVPACTSSDLKVILYFIGFEVLTAVAKNTDIFWATATCSVNVN